MLNDWLYEKFKLLSDKTALIFRGEKYSYSQFLNLISQYYDIIKLQIEKGEVVAIVNDYSFSSLAFVLALQRNQNIIVPIISTNKIDIDKRIDIGCVQKIVTFKDVEYEILNTESTKSNDLFDKIRQLGHAGLIIFSSGSTGEPKAMLHDLDILITSYKKDITKEINSLLFLTFDHIGGMDTLLRLLSIGGSITIPEQRSPDYICNLIEKFKVNVLPCSPTFLNLLIISESYKKYDLSSLKIIGFGAEPMPDFLLKKLNLIFPNVELHQKFGTSETNAVRVKNLAKDSLFMKIDDPNIEYKIIENELWIKSQTQILGYLNSSNDIFEDGWFKTGDIVEKYDNDFFRIIGRKNEIINIGGEKVIPTEIENIILQNQNVLDCIVYGVKNSITGESVYADIQISENCDAIKVKKEVMKLCFEKLSTYKCPVKIKVVDQINFNNRYKKVRLRG